jgi:hypothetical protein
MKTTHPPETLSYNQWIVHIYKLLNYPINDDGTKRETTKGINQETRIGQSTKSVRTSQQNRATEKTNRRGKT